MFGFGRGRTVWAAPMLLFLAILLVAALAFNVANLDTGGEAIPSVRRPTGSSPLPESFVSFEIVLRILFAVFAASAIVLTVVAFLRPRQRAQRVVRKASWWEIVGTLVSALFFLAMVLIIRRVSRESEGVPTPSPDGSGSGINVQWPTASGLPAEIFLIGGLFIGLVVVTFLLRRSSLFPRFREGDAVLQDRSAAAKAVQETIEHLELGADVRSAILACFHRFCLLLGERGVDDQRAMTAWELEAAAVDRLRVSRGDASQLTALFEEARYSAHVLGEAHRETAVRSLESIRAALEV